MDYIVRIVHDLGGVWIFLIVGAIGWSLSEMVRSIAKHLRLARQAEQLAVLKKSMIDRGMSADEIERVIRSGDETATSAPRKCGPRGPISTMAAQGMKSADIEKVIGSGLQTHEGPDEVVRAMSANGYSGDDIARVVGALDRRPRVPTV